MAQPGQIQVGQLYLGPNRNGLPVWSQPGGVGTKVFPAVPTQYPAQFQGYPQSVMSYPALYYSGCQHPLNCWEIFEFYDPYEQEQMVAVCCPMCSFVQQLLTAAEYYNYVETPIVVA
jgi:hypothetical protein